MMPDLQDIDAAVDRYLPSATTQQTEAAGAHVLHRLRFKAHSAAVDEAAHRLNLAATASRATWQPVVRVAASAALVVAAIGAAVVWRQDAVTAVATVVDGSLSRTSFTYSEPVRTGRDTGAMLSLADGSHVEMRAQSELSLERAEDGLGIRLVNGSIIVNAAKQSGGHLYVQTKDMTVSVIGTVFLVNTEASGSRVAVIEGEVRVREGTTETRLQPGEHVSTNPAVVPLPVKEEIAWSRNADKHLAILEAFAKGMAATSGPLTPLKKPAAALQAPTGSAVTAVTQGFEEASVRECDPDNLPATPEGARGGGPNSLLMTPGRLYAQCLTLATLIRTAYGFRPASLEFFSASEEPRRPRRSSGMRFDAVYGLGVEDGLVVRGGPAWVRENRYSIEAVGSATVTPEVLRGEMLQDLLERRFQLKVHIEAEQMPGYALVLAPGGLRMKPFQERDCTREIPDAVKAERARRGWTGPVLITEAAHFGIKPACGGVYGESNGPNFHLEAANSGPGIVAGLVGRSTRIRVVDRTNITGGFTFTWEFGIDEQTPDLLEDLQRGKTWSPKPGWDSPMTIPKAPSIFAAVEQLGLKLEPIRVPREFIVVDRVERPAPN